MKSQTLSRYFPPLLLASAVLLVAVPALAQEPRSIAVVESPVADFRPTQSCPEPINLTLDANTPNVFSGDFTPVQLANHVGLNYPGPNKFYLHTFQWKPRHRCCQITKAVLTVQMQANQGGRSLNSPDAGNDNINVMHNGQSVPPFGVRIYAQVQLPFNAGQHATTVFNLTGAALANINASDRLSFAVEDDTRVLSATLQLSGCCLTN